MSLDSLENKFRILKILLREFGENQLDNMIDKYENHPNNNGGELRYIGFNIDGDYITFDYLEDIDVEYRDEPREPSLQLKMKINDIKLVRTDLKL